MGIEHLIKGAMSRRKLEEKEEEEEETLGMWFLVM